MSVTFVRAFGLDDCAWFARCLIDGSLYGRMNNHSHLRIRPDVQKIASIAKVSTSGTRELLRMADFTNLGAG